jgi:hypothetical protein
MTAVTHRNQVRNQEIRLEITLEIKKSHYKSTEIRLEINKNQIRNQEIRFEIAWFRNLVRFMWPCRTPRRRHVRIRNFLGFINIRDSIDKHNWVIFFLLLAIKWIIRSCFCRLCLRIFKICLKIIALFIAAMFYSKYAEFSNFSRRLNCPVTFVAFPSHSRRIKCDE